LLLVFEEGLVTFFGRGVCHFYWKRGLKLFLEEGLVISFGRGACYLFLKEGLVTCF
jgi:hypothetical protein